MADYLAIIAAVAAAAAIWGTVLGCCVTCCRKPMTRVRTVDYVTIRVIPLQFANDDLYHGGCGDGYLFGGAKSRTCCSVRDQY